MNSRWKFYHANNEIWRSVVLRFNCFVCFGARSALRTSPSCTVRKLTLNGVLPDALARSGFILQGSRTPYARAEGLILRSCLIHFPFIHSVSTAIARVSELVAV